MRQCEAPPRRHFTQAARDAALARRRELAALPKDPAGKARIYVIRGAEAGNDFGWEIRRYGAILVARSDTGYPSEEAARAAGRHALRAFNEG